MSKPLTLDDRCRESCGTCTHWIARGKYRHCPILNHDFRNDADLSRFYCQNWRRETRESFAVELWEELS